MSELQSQFKHLTEQLGQSIIGQQRLLERLLIALLADGHLIVEGAPGLAKTTAIKALANCIDSDFHRIQFTPDLLPADLTGTDIYNQHKGSFEFQKGPLFHNILLADEINRAPAKVQSALLEAMGERQITVGQTTYSLPELFLVMATQNPLEQEGTYPLPEAQLDRFLMFVKIDYPSAEEELAILQLVRKQNMVQLGVAADENKEDADSLDKEQATALKINAADITTARQQVLDVHVADDLQHYMVQLVMATRQPQSYSDQLAQWIQVGASPRASISLDRCARARAWLRGRDYVSPEDIQDLAADILQHRIIASYMAEAEGIRGEDIVAKLIELVTVP